MDNLGIGEQSRFDAPQKPANRSWLREHRVLVFAVVILVLGALAFGWNSAAAAGGGLALLLVLCCAVMMGGMMMMTKDNDQPPTKRKPEDDGRG